MSTRNISDRDYKLLYGRSAGRCNICYREVFVSKVNGKGVTHVGEMAHAYPYSRKQSAPRFTEGSKLDNSYDNLILLCACDHKKVDQDTDFYTIEKLREIKRLFEEKIRALLGDIKSDFFLVDLINKSVNFQHLIANLGSPLYSLPFDITDIGDTENFLLPEYMPTYFPFEDQKLTNNLKEIFSSYRVLYKLIAPHYELKDLSTLTLRKEFDFNKHPSIPIKIQKAAIKLTAAIYHWIMYCKELRFIK